MSIMQEAARAKGVQLHILNAASESEIDAAFATLVEIQAGALVIDTICSSLAGESSSKHWLHAIPFRRSITGVNSSLPAA